MVRVLLIDDHEIFRLGLRSLFNASGGIEIVSEADNGADGLARLRQTPADIVVLDYAMPGITGLDVLQKIRRQAPETRLILLTASSSESVLAEALDEGVEGILLKQDGGEALVKAIRRVSAGGRYISPMIQPIVERVHALSRLTKRERQVLRMIAGGYRNREIGETLSISMKTVDSHRTNLMRKLDLHSLIDVVEFANKTGLLDPSI